MLGTELSAYLKNKKIKILETTNKRNQSKKIYFNINDNFKKNLKKFLNRYSKNISHIINCIGLTRENITNKKIKKKKLITINSLFPHAILEFINMKTKLINISTDSVFDGKKGNYKENDNTNPLDLYSKSKLSGETKSPNSLNIRCSIIGRDKNKRGLVEWFLKQKKKTNIYGYSNCYWNGVTVKSLSSFIGAIITKKRYFCNLRSKTNIIHFYSKSLISKYMLLVNLKKIFKKKIQILPLKKSDYRNFTLSSNYKRLLKITKINYNELL